jgi:drug/metabolite transporter (DMT)-like permease
MMTFDARRGTRDGLLAILTWATLALLTAWSGEVPPFQLVSMAFAVATGIGLLFWWRQGRAEGRSVASYALGRLKVSVRVWTLGVGGLFGYHFFYFFALRHAPAVQASLIAYLWPLLIVVLSAALPGERLRWWHLSGALAGLCGAVLLTVGDKLSVDARFAVGYGAAAACAVIWSGYSILSRTVPDVPSDTVTGFCGVTAALSLLAHLAFEQTVWPRDAGEWLAVAALGLGPVGGAFFLWDRGVKRGDIQVLGAAAYLAPLVSTVLLVGFGVAEPSWRVAAACVLITGGALLAAREHLRGLLCAAGGRDA